MGADEFTDSELLILGLLAEMPRHGYELEQVIQARVMREWTRIGFSSIYYVLGKLEKKGLIAAELPENEKARKRYELTDKGKQTLVDQTLAALETVQPTYPSLLLGMVHLPVLTQEQAAKALENRQKALAREQERIQEIHFKQQPLPDYVDAIFEYSIRQLKTEADWIEQTAAYLKNKRWLD